MNLLAMLFRCLSRPSRRAEENHRCNALLEPLLPPGPLNGQRLGVLSRFRLGRSGYGFSGCEVIAVYNACQLAGKPQPLSRVGWLCEQRGLPVLSGFWGTDPFELGQLLEAAGLKWEQLDSLSRMEQAGDGIFLMSFWNRAGNPFRGIHTVAVHRWRDHCQVFNRYNDSSGPVNYGGVREIMEQGAFLTAYKIV